MCAEHQSDGGVYWTPKKQLIPSLSGLGKEAVSIGDKTDKVMPYRVATAYNCEECKKVLLDYSE